MISFPSPGYENSNDSANSDLKLATMMARVPQTPTPALGTRLPADCWEDVALAVSDDFQLVATAIPVHPHVLVSNSGEKCTEERSCEACDNKLSEIPCTEIKSSTHEGAGLSLFACSTILKGKVLEQIT